VGVIASVEALVDGVVWVRLDGELWEARSDDVLVEADAVIVEAVDELTLQVKKQVRKQD